MKFNELPQAYQDLEKDFSKECFEDIDTKSNDLSFRFSWGLTPQGDHFWDDCYRAKSMEQLPPIPTSEKSSETSYVPPADLETSTPSFAIGEVIEVSDDYENWISGLYQGMEEGQYLIGNYMDAYKYARKSHTKPPVKFSQGQRVEVSNNGNFWFPAVYIQEKEDLHSVTLVHNDTTYGTPTSYDLCRPRFTVGERIEVSDDGKRWIKTNYFGHDSNGSVRNPGGRLFKHCRKEAVKSDNSFEVKQEVKQTGLPFVEPGTAVYVRASVQNTWNTDVYYMIGYNRKGDPVVEDSLGRTSTWNAVKSIRQADKETIKALAAKHGFDLTKF